MILPTAGSSATGSHATTEAASGESATTSTIATDATNDDGGDDFFWECDVTVGLVLAVKTGVCFDALSVAGSGRFYDYAVGSESAGVGVAYRAFSVGRRVVDVWNYICFATIGAEPYVVVDGI